MLYEIIEAAKRDLAREQTDYLGRMSQCLGEFWSICEDNGPDFSAENIADAEEALIGLAGMAVAQLVILRCREVELISDPALRLIEEGVRLPLRLCEEEPGEILDAGGVPVLQVDVCGEWDDDRVSAIAAAVISAVNRSGSPFGLLPIPQAASAAEPSGSQPVGA